MLDAVFNPLKVNIRPLECLINICLYTLGAPMMGAYLQMLNPLVGLCLYHLVLSLFLKKKKEV